MVGAAVRLLARVAGGPVAEFLRAEGRVVRGDDEGEGVVEGEDDEGQHGGGHEEGVGAGVAFADLEEGDPEEADADCGDAEDGGAEEEEGEEEEDDVVDGEDFGELVEEGVDGVEDLGLPKEVAAAGAADGVLDLVDAGDEHAGEDDEREDEEDQAAEEFEGSEDGFGFGPGADEEVVAFALVFGGEALAADESAFFADEGFELATFARVETALAPFVAAFELALTFAVLVQLAGGRGCELRRGDARCRFDQRDGEERQAGSCVETVEDCPNDDEDANGESQGALAIWRVSVLVHQSIRLIVFGDSRFSVSRYLK